MTTLVGISGSARRGSFNSALLRAAAAAMPADAELRIESIAQIPLYNGDVEAEQGIPAPVARLKDAIAAADGLLLVTPEYNNSIPGVFKNAIDWLSRPDTDIARVFRGRPVALMGASPGRFGTTLSQAAWLPVLRTLGTRPWFEERLLVFEARKAFDESGKLVDPHTRERMVKFVEGFGGFVAANAQSRKI
jgi:NAD(P)H-dependent FMN reductase